MPVTLTGDGAQNDRVVLFLEKLGLLRDDTVGRSTEDFINIGLKQLEAEVGSFAGAAEKCSASLLLYPIEMKFTQPYFGLNVSRPLVVDLPALRLKLGPVESDLAKWFLMNLRGPSIYGPFDYSCYVSMARWQHESDESEVLAQYKHEGMSAADIAENLYTKAQLIADTAPWICEHRLPDGNDEMLVRLAAIDKTLAAHFDHFLKTRASYDLPKAMSDMEDMYYLDCVIFRWEIGHITAEVYDEVLNMEFESSTTMEWAWLAPLNERADLALIREAAAYHDALRKLALYIKETYPE